MGGHPCETCRSAGLNGEVCDLRVQRDKGTPFLTRFTGAQRLNEVGGHPHRACGAALPACYSL